VIIFGILSNSLLLSLFTLIAAGFKRSFFNCFPRMFYKVICWYGVWTLFDPYVTLIIDIASQVKIYKNLYYFRDGKKETISNFTIFITKSKKMV